MSKRSLAPLGATDSGLRLAKYPVGSRQSRAAARALLVARESKEEFRVQCYSAVDGRPINFGGLAETISAARKRVEAEESGTPLPATEGSADFIRERRADCLAERIRRARERTANWRSQDSTR